MVENKRFTMDEDGNITDTVEDRTLYVENRYTACKYFINLLNELYEENEQLKQSNKWLRANRKDCEKGRRNEQKSFKEFDKSRVEHIRFLQQRLKDNGLSIYRNE